MTDLQRAALLRFWQRHHQAVIVICLLICLAGAYYGGYLTGRPIIPTPSETGAQLASQTTVLFPSTMTYAQQAAITKGTGLAGVDFLYVEKKTGIDALSLMSIAIMESTDIKTHVWGTNYWANTYNNIMSFGISSVNPDRTKYKTKTENVYVAAKFLKEQYLTKGGEFYHNGSTLWDVNYYYCPGSRGSLAWANGINTIITELEAKMSYEQRMKRWCVKTQLFTPSVKWDYEHIVTGYSLYKANNSAVISGR